VSKRDIKTLAGLLTVISAEDAETLPVMDEIEKYPKVAQAYISIVDSLDTNYRYNNRMAVNRLYTRNFKENIDLYVNVVNEYGRQSSSARAEDLDHDLEEAFRETYNAWPQFNDYLEKLLKADPTFTNTISMYAYSRDPAIRLESLEDDMIDALRKKLANISNLIKYAADCIEGRWPELEQILLERGNSNDLYSYSASVADDFPFEWPEYEEFLDKEIESKKVGSINHLYAYWYRNLRGKSSDFVKAQLDKALSRIRINDNEPLKREIIRIADEYQNRIRSIDDWPELQQARRKLRSY
jgi:hypothetical protein